VSAIGLLSLIAVGKTSTEPIPPTWLFSAAGILVAGVSAIAIYIAAQRPALPERAAITLAAAFACIAIAKFTFAPLGFYQENQNSALDTPAGPEPMVLLIAGGVLLVYIAVLRVIYRAFGRVRAVRQKKPLTIGLVLVTVASAAWLVVVAPILAALVAIGPLRYLQLVFTSALGAAVALTLLFATGLVAMSFSSARDRADVVSRASMLASILWVATAFVLLFHVLWVVFLLSLMAVWPLRTVTPK
jgi:hypothetical protein